jgi:hypothetical protein
VYRAKTGTTVLQTKNISASCAPSDYIGATGTCQFNSAAAVSVQLFASKNFIRSGATVDLSWKVSGVPNMGACTFSGPQMPIYGATDLNGSWTTSPLNSYSIFTLSCTSGTSTVSAATNIEVVPTVKEN